MAETGTTAEMLKKYGVTMQPAQDRETQLPENRPENGPENGPESGGPSRWYEKPPEEQAASIQQHTGAPDRLAALLRQPNEAQWQDIRTALAKALGWQASALDRMRAGPKTEAGLAGQGRPVEFLLPEPDPHPPALSDLLDQLAAALEAELYLPDHASTVMSLWAAMSWLHGDLPSAPYLYFTGAKPGCGKTTASDRLGQLCPKQLVGASTISLAALFRIIELEHPTLIFDNVDAVFTDRDNSKGDLRALLLSSHTRSQARVYRCVGEDNEPRQFDTWAPVIMNGIGKAAPDMMSRCIVITMIQRPKNHQPQKPGSWHEQAGQLAAQLMATAQRDRPELLTGIRRALRDEGDREADLWRPLTGIADVAGGPWPERVRAARIALTPEPEDNFSAQEKLLLDIASLFAEQQADWMTIQDIAHHLPDMRPEWADWARGKPISEKSIGRLLAKFDLKARKGTSGDRKKGYDRQAVEATIARHMPDWTGKEAGS